MRVDILAIILRHFQDLRIFQVFILRIFPLRLMFAVYLMFFYLMFIIYVLYYFEIGSLCAHFVETFYYKWVLNFVKNSCCIYWDEHMIFILQVVNMIYHIDCFVYIEESSHSWNKSHSIMVYDHFYVLLDSVCFVEDFCIAILQWY